IAAPTAYKAMLALLGDDGAPPALRCCVAAGENLPEPIWHDWYHATGIKLINGIGATEMMHIFISASGDDIRPGTTGQPVPGYQAMVSSLRQARDEDGRSLCRADLYLGSSGFNAQMKYADRRNSPCAIIQGGDEKAKGIVQIKDLILGAQVGGDAKDREAFLQKQQGEAQIAVPEGKLVEEVKKILTRHNVPWAK
ncbi:MAG: AMP-binding protein, partial [Rhizobiales bacterium]|nr:AMP-binding protein [Hyphomicrobiales bacterium]